MDTDDTRPQQGQQASPAGAFREAGKASLQTPQNERERDLAEVIRFAVQNTGGADTPEHKAFEQSQKALGERITREADPAKRAALRNEREAQGHSYVAALTDKAAAGLELMGRKAEAAEARQHAAVRREIADGLRNPPGHEKAEQKRADFAKDAAAIGRQIGMGDSAKTVHVATLSGRSDYRVLRNQTATPAEPQPDAVQARNRAQLRAHIRPEIVNDMGRQTVTATATAKPERKAEEAAAYRRSEESARQATATQNAQHGRTTTAAPASGRAAYETAIKSLESASAKAKEEPTRSATQTAFRSASRGMSR